MCSPLLRVLLITRFKGLRVYGSDNCAITGVCRTMPGILDGPKVSTDVWSLFQVLSFFQASRICSVCVCVEVCIHAYMS